MQVLKLNTELATYLTVSPLIFIYFFKNVIDAVSFTYQEVIDMLHSFLLYTQKEIEVIDRREKYTVFVNFMKIAQHRWGRHRGLLCSNCPDITSLTHFAPLPCSWTWPLQSFFPLCLCIWHCFQTQLSRRAWKWLLQQMPSGFVLDDPRLSSSLSSCHAPLLYPSYPHLLGGKAWISPFPLSPVCSHPLI